MSCADTDLIADLRNEASGAWERLIDRYAHLALSVPLRLGLSQTDAEEVCQATWVILHRHLMLIENPGSLSAWILTTASREATKLQRAGARFSPLGPDVGGDLEDPQPSPREAMDRLERIQEVRDHVASMAAPHRRLLNKLFFDPREPSYALIAQELDIPIGSIGPMRGRCLAGLAEKIRLRASAKRTRRAQPALGIERVV